MVLLECSPFDETIFQHVRFFFNIMCLSSCAYCTNSVEVEVEVLCSLPVVQHHCGQLLVTVGNTAVSFVLWLFGDFGCICVKGYLGGRVSSAFNDQLYFCFVFLFKWLMAI